MENNIKNIPESKKDLSVYLVFDFFWEKKMVKGGQLKEKIATLTFPSRYLFHQIVFAFYNKQNIFSWGVIP